MAYQQTFVSKVSPGGLLVKCVTPNTIIAYSQNIADEQKPVVHAIARYIFLQEGIYSGRVSVWDDPNVLLLKDLNSFYEDLDQGITRSSESVVNASVLGRLPLLPVRESASLPSTAIPLSALPSTDSPVSVTELFSNLLFLPQWPVDLVGATLGDVGASARYVEGMLNSGLRQRINHLLPEKDFKKKATQQKCSPEDARSMGMWVTFCKLVVYHS